MQYNTAIRGIHYYGMFAPPYHRAASFGNHNYYNGLGYLPKTNVDESESSSCITSVTAATGKSGRDEWTDSGSDPEYDTTQKRMQTNSMSMRLWFEKKGNDNIAEANNEKHRKQKKPKVVVTLDSLGKADLLRQTILEYVFERTGRLVTNQVLKLTSRHEKEKIIRFNEICLQHIVAPRIEEKYGKKRNHFPLCIDKCPHCPAKAYRISNNMTEWCCVKSRNPSVASHELRDYISSYSNKQTRGHNNAVVKYSDLRLNVHLFDTNTTQPLISQQHKIKIMKGEYFNKIRTPTPKAPTQPLNLTYARFWVEIVKDYVYLCIIDVEALKSYDEKQGTRRPIKSVIGAYVDGRMEVELAIMSSFAETDVVFEWFVRKDYTNQYFQNGLTLGLQLTGNKEMRDWTWYETVTDTNVFAYNYTGHYQWPRGPSAASLDYSVPPVIQPLNNNYEQNWSESNYRMQGTMASNIGWQDPANCANSAPMPIPTMTTPSPTLESIQTYEPSPSNFNNVRTERIQKNDGNKHGTKRKRIEMSEAGVEESLIMPFPSKRPAGLCQTFYKNDLTLFGENPHEEQRQLTIEWCPEMDPLYNRLRCGSTQ